MEIFHGGCIGCTMQDTKGIEYCLDCQNFSCNWDLPDLNDMRIAEKERKNKIRDIVKSLKRDFWKRVWHLFFYH